MVRRTILLIVLNIFCTVHSVSLENIRRNIEKRTVRNAYRLSNVAVPIHYNIKLDLHITTDNYTGDTQLDIEVRNPTTVIVFNSEDLIIDESLTNITKEDKTLRPYEHIYDEDIGTLCLTFYDTLEPGVYKLNLKYEGILADDNCGIFKSFYQNDQNETIPIIGTHFQLISARRAFPCWDEPAFKATFNISLKHDDNYTALSNMPAYMVERDESDGKVWTHFQTTPIMSTNILAVSVHDYPHISNADSTVRIWAPNKRSVCLPYFMEIVERVTMELTRYLNSTFHVPKMDHVVYPNYSSKALENWGLIMYMDAGIPCNMSSDHAKTKMWNVMTVTHELAHQWFGNLVSPSWWTYYWLSEGMSTYLEFYITDKFFPDWKLMDIQQTHMQIDTFKADDRNGIPPINKNLNNLQAIRHLSHYAVYRKPSLIISMLSHIVGEDVFRAGLSNYVRIHEYGIVTSDNLWEAIQGALSDSGTSITKLNIKNVMDTWIEQVGYPFVIVTRNDTTGRITIRQELSPFSRDRTIKKWWIPLNYATKSVPDFSSTKPTFWLSPKHDSLEIEGVSVDDWIIVNVQQTGYYCVNYDLENWKKIMVYLNSDNYTKIHAANRVQLIHTAFRLTTRNHRFQSFFIELANYLRSESDPIVWTSIFEILVQLKELIKYSGGGDTLRQYIVDLMNNFIETIGYEHLPTDNDFLKSVREETIRWACLLNHPGCEAIGTARLNAYLEDREMNGIPSAVEEAFLCAGLSKASPSTWNKVLDLKVKSTEENLYNSLHSLSCSKDPNIIESYFNLSIAENSTILNRINPTTIFMQANDNVMSTVDAQLDFVIKHFDRITNSTHEKKRILDNLIWKINRMDQIDKLETFLHTKGINIDSSIDYRKKHVRKQANSVSRISSLLNEKNSQVKPVRNLHNSS